VSAIAPSLGAIGILIWASRCSSQHYGGISPSSTQIHSGGLPLDMLEIRQKITLLALKVK